MKRKRHRFWRRMTSGFTAVMMVLSSLSLAPISAFAEDEGHRLRLHYDMKVLVEQDGRLIVPNQAGSAFAGILREIQAGSHAADEDVGFLTFSGGNAASQASYVEIPKGPEGQDVLEGLDEVTVSAIVNWTNDGVNRWIFGFGTVLTPETNKYLFATPRHGIGGRDPVAAGISKEGWPNEALITGENNSLLAEGVWKHIVVTMSEEADRLALYVDGVKVNEGTAKGIKLAEIIDPDAAYSGFLAKSIFTNDPYYKGSIADFRVYESAFTAAEAADLYTEAEALIERLNRLTIDDAADSLDIATLLHEDDRDPQAVTRNLTLPAVGKHGVKMDWTSSRPDVISASGVVTRPGLEAEDVEVTLTAELSYQGLTRSVEFDVKVLKEFDPAQRARLDADELRVYNADNVKGHLRLPTEGSRGSKITWISNRPDVVRGSAEAVSSGDEYELGRVTRQSEDTAVKLTARVEYDDAVVERNFDLLVVKAPEPLDYDAYFFAYFTGEYEGGEEISFAVAEDPLYWRSLNNGQSVLQSTMGEKGVRDPFIIRSPEGDKFYMLATDLKMGESTNFDEAQITGSHYMVVWESDDLVNWSEQRMVKVAPEHGGNTWAPEAFYDEKTGEYVVFWASSMKIEDTYGKYPNGRPPGQYNVMYYATTRDFYEFSEPKVFIDDGFPTIDTTIIEHDGVIYRMTKSEVNYKVYLEKAGKIYDDLDGIAENGFQFELVPGTRSGNQGLIGHGGNNEGPTIFKDIHEEKWYLFLDSWPYHVRWTTDLEDGAQLVNNWLPESEYALPPGPRHGTVIPITRAEYEALIDKYGVPGPAEQAAPVVHYTFDPDDVDGSTVFDVSGNGYHAELIGGAAIVEEDRVGEAGGALALDGSSGYAKLPDHLIQNLNLEKATFAVWVKLDQQRSGQRIFDFASNTGRAVNRNTMYLSPRGDSGGLEFAIVTPFTEKFANAEAPLDGNYKYALRGNRLLPIDAWQHVAVTIDGFEAAVYVNGEQVASSSVYNVEPRMLLETTMNFIGKSRSSSHPYLAGRVDDFRIYNRALTGEEIAVLAEGAETPGEAPSEAELVLHYDMKHVEGERVRDQTGSFDGTWRNPQAAEWIATEDAGVISFSGGATASYIELPGGVLDGLSDISVSALINWSGKLAAEWLYALGRPATNTHYTYFTPRYNADSSARFGLATNGWRNEASAKSTKLSANEWKLVTTVLDGANETLSLYIDGKLVASEGTNGIGLDDIRSTSGHAGYIARSFYSEDPYFGGMIADFRIYDGALTAGEVADLQAEAALKIAAMEGIFLQAAADKLTWAEIAGANESPDRVIADLMLLGSGAYGTTITWSSSAPDVITPAGVVKRPAFEAGDQVVTLTATFSDGENSLDKVFTVTVSKLPNDERSVDWAIEALIVHNVHDVRGHLTLPTRGLYDTTITWLSSAPDVISATGEVSRPEHGQGDRIVTLTATIRKGSVSKTKEFSALVRELPEPEPYEGYFFAYFTGEGRANGEQIYFALSEGNDPLRWVELNDGQPVLTSTLGERGVRDPFIIRSPEGDRFYMIATDLRIYGNGDWGRAQRHGSRSIMVWESTDLIEWSEQRMVQVSPPEAGNTWAPEIIYDDTTGEYVVFWASILFADPEHTGWSHQRIMYAKTRDFYTFTEPQVYMDYGYSIIDTTMIQHDGKIYRFTKDERNNDATTLYGKTVFQEVGDSVFDPDFKLIREGVGDMKWVEGPTIFRSNTEEKWYLFVDEFGGRGYVPLETTDLDSGVWTEVADYKLPSSPRHGTVIPLKKSEYEAIYAKYVAEHVPVTGVSLDRSEATMEVGDVLQLTATVSPNYASNPQVSWTSSDEQVAVVTEDGLVQAVGAGSAVIKVTTVEGGYAAEAVVTVLAKPPTKPGIVREVQVAEGDRQLMLSWQDPTEVGAGLKHIYVAAYDRDTVTASVYVDPGVGAATLGGLTNGVTYDVWLAAADVEGMQSDFVVVQGTPQAAGEDPEPEPDPEKPGDVSEVRVVEGDGRLMLSWTDPVEVGAGLKHIYVAAYDGDTVTASVYVEPGVGAATLGGLTNGVTYDVLLVVVDSEGLESEGIIVQGTPRRQSSLPPIPPSPPVVTPSEDDQPPLFEISVGGVILVHSDGEGGLALTAQLPVSALLGALSESPDNRLRIQTDGWSILIDGGVLDGLDGDSLLGLSLTAPESSSLSPLMRTLAMLQGIEQIYAFGLTIDGQPVSGLPVGSIILSLDHDVVSGIGNHQLVVHRLGADGSLTPLAWSRYDERSGRMLFQPDDLTGYYGILVMQAGFDDVSGWAEEAIEALAARGVILGKGEGMFDPQGVVTRAEFMAMLVRLFGLHSAAATVPFTDIPAGAWYLEDLAAAYEAGIVTGKPDGTFSGEAPITRQEMAVLLYRAAARIEALADGGEGAVFADAAEIAAYAQEAVRMLAASGILNGMTDGNFGPEMTATRERAAAILWRLLQLIVQ